MVLNLKKLTLIPFCIIFVLVVRIAVSLHVFPSLQNLSYLVLAFCLLNFVIMAFFTLRERTITILAIVTILYYLLLFAFSIISDTNFVYTAYAFAEILLMQCLFAYYKNRIKVIVLSFAISFSAIIYINLLIMIFFPTWMLAGRDIGESFLLGGNYNQIGSRVMMALVTSAICVRYSKWWILNSILIYIASLFTLLLVSSMTSSANVLVYGLFCLIPSLKIRKLMIATIFFLFILFQVFVVFNGQGIQQNEFAVYIIEDVLGKDITFTNRTFLWDKAGQLFQQSPLFGYGNVDADWYLSNLSSDAVGPHNFIYNVLLSGGITLLLCYFLICWFPIKKLLPNLDMTSSHILMGIALLMFMMIMEVYSMFFVVFLLTLAFYYNEIKESFSQSKRVVKYK